jgi:Baseplate J-like protein
MIYSCCNENRKSAVLGNAALNGIDYLEVLDSGAPPGVPRQQTLLVHCLNPLPASATFVPANVTISGGESITQIGVAFVVAASVVGPTEPPEIAALLPAIEALTDKPNVIVVGTRQTGDFSPYRLRLVNDAAQAAADPFAITEVLDGFDPLLAEVEFSFKVECGPDFDCAPAAPDCGVPPPAPPPINYLAKDYGSFRTIILDRLHQLLPSWGGSSEADLGIMLAELVAYVGDHLSYQQDAVATEAYLATARRRVSLRRHALLVDYRVQEGCNARAWIVLQVSGNAGVPVFLDRTQTRFYTGPPGTTIPANPGGAGLALPPGVQVFEPMHDAVLYSDHNELFFYTWGDENCCLPKGATEATLLGPSQHLKAGDVLIFQEMLGPQTGNPADADITHRCAVRLTAVATEDGRNRQLADALFKDAAGNPTKVTEIQWAAADALPFPVCISSTYLDAHGDQHSASNVSVAFGNVVLADHGLSVADVPLGTVPSPRLQYPRDPAADRCLVAPPASLPVRFRPRLPDRPLTQAVPLAVVPQPVVGIPDPGATVPLGPGPVVLKDHNGFPSLTLNATSPALWPQYFGVLVSANTANPQNFDLTVFYNPPGGAAGIFARVQVENFTDLSLHGANANYVAHQINADSKLIRVPNNYVPPSGPLSGFPAAPTMLTNTGTIELQDLSPQPVVYLSLEANAPADWAQHFGVRVQADPQDASHFELSVFYNAPTAVTVEQFPGLSLANAQSAVAASSRLIAVENFAQAPDPGLSASDLMNFDPRQAVPAITLRGSLDGLMSVWNGKPDLLESGESDLDFVVELETDGTALLRFGDGANGEAPQTGTAFTAAYRIGNGTAGNVGADTITRLSSAGATALQSCRNPLSAGGGTDPETAAQIRRRAPEAFLIQERAVTMADYEAMAERDPQVERAAASLRWTGSWYTVFVAAEPHSGGNLPPPLAAALIEELEKYRLAGQDLDIDSPHYVSLDIALAVCVDPDYFQADVERALLQILSNRPLPDGRKGVFYPDNFGFGQTVYLSPVYAAARSVAGVVSVTATRFQPQGVDTSQYLDAGALPLSAREIARLDNDRNFPSHGQLTLTLEGGR